MKHILLISIGLILFSFISVAQDLDLKNANVKLKNNEKKVPKIDTITRLNEIKFNYSYFSGLDFFLVPDVVNDTLNNINTINRSKSGVFSLSFHHRVNKWKYGLGLNYSNYKIQEKVELIYYNLWNEPIYYSNIYNTNYNIFTAFTTFERFIYKKFYLGLHLGCNIINENSEDLLNSEDRERYFLPYTKICFGYQYKLSNRLNFNLELGVGGSMTNTGVSYMFR